MHLAMGNAKAAVTRSDASCSDPGYLAAELQAGPAGVFCHGYLWRISTTVKHTVLSSISTKLDLCTG